MADQAIHLFVFFLVIFSFDWYLFLLRFVVSFILFFSCLWASRELACSKFTFDFFVPFLQVGVFAFFLSFVAF